MLKDGTDLTWPVSRGSCFVIWLRVCIACVSVAWVVTGIRCSSGGSSGGSCRRLHWRLCRWRPTGGGPVSCRPARHLWLTLGSSPVNTTVLLCNLTFIQTGIARKTVPDLLALCLSRWRLVRLFFFWGGGIFQRRPTFFYENCFPRFRRHFLQEHFHGSVFVRFLARFCYVNWQET